MTKEFHTNDERAENFGVWTSSFPGHSDLGISHFPELRTESARGLAQSKTQAGTVRGGFALRPGQPRCGARVRDQQAPSQAKGDWTSLQRIKPRTLLRLTEPRSAFTLVELLTVIAVIGVLAALLLPVAGAVKRREYINTATAEMQKIETALERYKAQYGFYPPSGTNVLENPLYAELVGTTNVGTTTFNSLDGNMQGMTPEAFGMSGFVNCSKPGAGGENSQAATDFIGELKPTQIAAVTNMYGTGATNALLTVSVGGPDASYKPVGIQGANPWRYVYPGTNNPSSYDLWVQLVIGGKSNLVCNWSDKVPINAPYP